MARPRLGESDTERLHVKISADEIEAIENWRYANRVPSKSEAVRRLVQIGLRASRALPSIVKDVAEVLDLASEAIDIPEEVYTTHVLDEPETVAIDAEIARKLYDNVNFTFNRQIEAQDNLFHLLVELSQFVNNEQFDAAMAAADKQASSSIPNEDTLIAIGATRKPQLDMWRKRRQRLAAEREENLKKSRRRGKK